MPTLTLEKSAQVLFQDAAEESIRSSLDEIIRHWDGVRSGDDADAVHDMRVATRRLRASLSVFQAAFPAKVFQKFEQKIAYLTDALGEARDTDVFLQYMRGEADALEEDRASEKVGVDQYIKFLKSQRSGQQSDLLKTLKRLDPAELRKDGKALLAHFPKKPENPLPEEV